MKGPNSTLSYGFFDYLYKSVINVDLKIEGRLRFEDIDIMIRAYQQY